MYLLKKIHFKYNKIDIFSFLIITYLLFIIFPFTLNNIPGFNFLNEGQIKDFIGARTINAVLQFLIICFYFFKVITRGSKFKLDNLSKMIFALLLYNFLHNAFILNSSFKELLNFSYHNSYHLKYFINILTFTILSNEIESKKELKNICINSIILSSVLISLIFVLTQILDDIPILGVTDGFFNSTGKLNVNYSRYSFLSWNPNEISLFFNFAITFLITKLIQSTKNKAFTNIILIVFTLIIINGIILTGTRAGIIILGFCIFTSIIYLINQKYLNKKIVILFVLLGISFSRIFFTFSSLRKRLVIDDNFLDLGGRLSNWINDFQFYSESPFLGRGITDYFSIHRNSLPENLFLELLITNGLIGFIILIFIIIKFIKNNYFLSKSQNSIENILLISCLFIGLTSLNIISIKSYWFILAICNSNIIKFQKSKNNNPLLKIPTENNQTKKNL